jgi:hypothetical protein
MVTVVGVLMGITMVMAYIVFVVSVVTVLFARYRSAKLFAVVSAMASIGAALALVYYQAGANVPAVLVWLLPVTTATILTVLVRAIVFVANPSHYVSWTNLFAAVTLYVTALLTVVATLQFRLSVAGYILLGGFTAWTLVKAARSMQWRELQRP